MKKFFVILMAALFVMPMTMDAQNKQLEKARKKEFKTKMKELSKEDWKIFASTRSLDVALLEHYEKLNTMGDNAYELVGIAAKFKSKNVGKQQALNSACIAYAQHAKSYVQGRIVSDMAGDGVAADNEFDNFYAAYERLVSAEIKGELRESFSIIRDLGDGTFEMQTFFIVDQDAASKARIRAMENALKETEMAQKHATKVSEFVNEGFRENQ
mgnify:CR=1 FL=1